jgi:hypothetical protein
MVVSAVAALGRGMDGNVGDDAVLDEFLFDEVADQLDPLLVRQFVGQGQLEFTGELRCAAARAFVLPLFDAVPETGARVQPVGDIVGGEDEGLKNAALAGVVFHLAGALVEDSLGRPVGRGRHSRLPCGAADDLGGEAVFSHGSPGGAS